MRNVLRSVLGVAAGFAVMAGIVITVTPAVARYYGAEDFRVLNQAFMLANLAYTTTAAILAGFITAWIAGRRELRHASVLGMLMIFLSFLSMRELAEQRPGWYEIVLGGCGPVAALVGAALCQLVCRR